LNRRIPWVSTRRAGPCGICMGIRGWEVGVSEVGDVKAWVRLPVFRSARYGPASPNRPAVQAIRGVGRKLNRRAGGRDATRAGAGREVERASVRGGGDWMRREERGSESKRMR